MVCRSTADVVVIVFQSYCSSHGDSNDQALCLLQRQRSVCKGGGSYQLRLLGNKVCVVSVWLISASGPVSHPLQALCPDLTACSVYLSRVGGCWQLEQPSWIQAIYCMCSCFIESCLAFHPAFKSSYMVACVSMAECVWRRLTSGPQGVSRRRRKASLTTLPSSCHYQSPHAPDRSLRRPHTSLSIFF